MKQVHLGMVVVLILLCTGLFSQGQQTVATATDAVVPPLVNFSGILTDSNGKPLTGTVAVTFSLYSHQTTGAALWMETQNIQPDRTGHYTVLLGSTSSTGLPADIFVAGEAHWLGVQVQGQEEEQPRVLLVSAPYALKAGDAQTLGGLPASAFVLAAPPTADSASAAVAPAKAAADSASPGATSDVTTTGGTVNFLPLFSTATNIQNSILTQSGTGTINVGGKLNLPATGAATAAAGKTSRPQTFVAASYNSTTSATVQQTFQLQAEPAGNDTGAPSGTLSVLFASGTAAPAETGLKIAGNGQITFAAGQMFPNTPQLSSNNTFSGTQIISGTNASGVLEVTNTATGGTPLGIVGTTPSVGGTGVLGNATSTTASDVTAVGVEGKSASPSGVGVLGFASATSGTTAGITGSSVSPTGYGVQGFGPNVGVYGDGTGSSGIGVDGHGTFQGVKGVATATKGSSEGVYGQAASSSGYGVYGTSSYIGVYGTGSTAGLNGVGTGGDGYGVIGAVTGSSVAAGVEGSSSSPTGFGVYGQVNASTGSTAGVFGTVASSSGYGVEGVAPNVAVYGSATSSSSFGVEGTSPNVGVYGVSDRASTTGKAYPWQKGVWGDTGAAIGLYAAVMGTADDNHAGWFENDSPSGTDALIGLADSTGSGNASGVFGVAVCCSSESGIGASSGVWGDIGSSEPGAGVVGTADDHPAGDFFNSSKTHPTLYLENDGGGPTDTALLLATHGNSGDCTISASGGVACTGKMASVVPTEGGARKFRSTLCNQRRTGLKILDLGRSKTAQRRSRSMPPSPKRSTHRSTITSS